ncbi:BREX-1 system adenine-specific DNA-methyltransferase PglX [Lacticaseibacillus jixianensis]|uniref:site-specific DNA-methyltransferase (adenine-specific) n=1 Tax=Lacticaseibacillus jixianensis TaxID=2486012 RepID=A0ABW4B9E0_9LACO|nr:BREX-1 system adenine-specific DNA-methyltransferase PglX [Lacticaseibacillus jixianensis]
MDKKIIETFATAARRGLVDAVKLRLEQLSITDKGAEERLPSSTSAAEFYAGNPTKPLTGSDIGRRKAIIARLERRSRSQSWSEAFYELVEEAAYTWFNRVIALRFMEVNDYLPSGTRVLSSVRGTSEPDIMTDARDIEDALGGYSSAERSLIDKAWENQDPASMDKLYQMLFLKQVNALSKNLPNLFEPTKDYLRLLFTPSYHSGVIKALVTNIPEADFDLTESGEGQVEIIGWLYQYYNEEPHNQVVNLNGGAVKEADIPAATQLFTTDWVVRYMVDNSLGRYYLEHFSSSNIAAKLKYLVPEKIHQVSTTIDLAKLRFLDNAMGSGHILVYAFDVLMEIYQEQGFTKREAARNIASENLFGLEIDKRAFQLAYFAIMMKVRQYDRHALDGDIHLNLYEFESSSNLTDQILAQLGLNPDAQSELLRIRDQFTLAKSLGSIIDIADHYNTDLIYSELSAQKNSHVSLFEGEEVREQIQGMLHIVDLLQDKYDVVVTNPPYLNKMDKPLKDYVKTHYKGYSGDLFSVFVWINAHLTKPDGYAAYMTPMVWMFIKTFQALRQDILDHYFISSLIQMETHAFFDEAFVTIDSFILQNHHSEPDWQGSYIRLTEFTGGMQVQQEKTLEAIQDPTVPYFYRTNQANFGRIPGSPIAYWVNYSVASLWTDTDTLGSKYPARKGVVSGDNGSLIRLWFEPRNIDIWKGGRIDGAYLPQPYKFALLNKGGKYRKWYGNQDYVLRFDREGYDRISSNKGHRSPEYYFYASYTWSSVSSGDPSFRYSPEGSISGSGGYSIFLFQPISVQDKCLLGFLNSTVANFLLKILNPTINLGAGDIQNLPLRCIPQPASVQMLIQTSLTFSMSDWDSNETSRDFSLSPLLAHIVEHQRNWTLEAAFNRWSKEAQDRFDQLKSNEEELNRIFIDLYELNDELTPEVADKDVSVRRADRPRDIKSFLSYFIGVTFGRYSIDTPGLAYAGGDWDDSKYESYKPNKDNLILLTDEEYFGDERDIIFRLKEFLTATFGAEHLDENIRFIADSLDKKGETPEDQIRKYFLDDFYKKDHLSTYQKRPIYWEFSSGRQDGFKALIYLHRYDANTMAMVRTAYLHPLQDAYMSAREQLQRMRDTESQTREKSRIEKQLTKLNKQIDEIVKYDAKLQHVANMHIAIDLDDGVLVNHEKVQAGEKLLSTIK